MSDSTYRTYAKWRALGLIASCFVFFAHYWLPDKTLPLEINADNAELYGYSDRARGKSAQWLGDDWRSWTCDFQPSDAYGCGWSVFTSPAAGQGLDLRPYKALEIELRYRGPATRLRVFLRNHNPAYARADDPASSMPMETSFTVAEAQNPVLLPLGEFRVAGWWLAERKSRRAWQMAEFDNIISVGVDFAERGFHEVEIQRLTLIGRWISTERLLIGLLSFWMAIFLGEGLVRFYRLYRSAQRDRQAIYELEEKQRRLGEENLHLENLAHTDPLTGVYNHAGLQRRLASMAARDKGLAGGGVLSIDLDHFKLLNDRYGHDMGDKILKTFAALLTLNLRNEDIIARTGGEKFVVVCRRQPTDGIHAFAEKIRQLAGQYIFNGDEDPGISISIGVAVLAEEDDIEDALQRAGEALSRAKRRGGNRVEFNAP